VTRCVQHEIPVSMSRRVEMFFLFFALYFIPDPFSSHPSHSQAFETLFDRAFAIFASVWT
jgi:hypothetical protein